MKTKIAVIIVIAILAAGFSVFAFMYLALPKQTRHKPDLKEEIRKENIIPERRQIVSLKANSSQKRSFPPGEAELTQAETLSSSANELKAKTKNDEGVTLISNPESMVIKVLQGSKEKGEFELRNLGKAPCFVNIYKSSPDITEDELKARINEIREHKKEVMGISATKETLEKAALFNGAPWLTPFPYYAVLDPGESKVITIAVNAQDLEAKEYTVYVIAMGQAENQTRVLTVNIEVGKGPKIKISKIEVNDALSKEANTNSNNIANPGEKVSVTVFFRNEGSGQAKDLRVKIAPNDSTLTLLSEPEVSVPFVAPQGEFQVSFLAEVSTAAHPEIPPSVSITLTDDKGTQTVETPYLGDADKIHYPLGLKSKEEIDNQQSDE